MHVASIVGARPQFVKAAMISRALRAKGVNETLVHTGQHYDRELSDVFFRELDIRASVNIGVGSGSHGWQTGRMLERVESLLLSVSSDLVITYGDTNSTLAGALAAVKLHIPLAHVEAGLRSSDKRMPEEVNRVLTDHASDFLFAPTETAVSNLRREGIPETRIYSVGDVMYDAALYYGAHAGRNSRILADLDLNRGAFILATVHRAENTDDPQRLGTVFRALMEIGCGFPVVLPVHPRTKSALQRSGMWEAVSRSIRIIAPVGYLDMIALEKNARLIVTDSGGMQKEAFFYEVPCVTLREQTEWLELVDLGWNTVTPPYNTSRVVESIRDSLCARPTRRGKPFGDGHSAERIVAILQKSIDQQTAKVGEQPAMGVAD